MKRVFVAIKHSADPSRYYGRLWSDQFYPALRAMGWEVVESQVDLLPASRFMHVAEDFTPEELQCRAAITERILTEVREEHVRRPIDLFLSYFYNAHFSPDGFAELRRMGIPSVNFYCNSVYQFELVREVARAADVAWHTERIAGEKYRDCGANPFWGQLAVEPSQYRTWNSAPSLNAAVFVGQMYADRDRWLAALIRAGLPVHVYGNGWGAPESGTRCEDAGSGKSGTYLGRRMLPPGSCMAYAQVVWANICSKGPWSGVGRTVRQLRMRSRTRQRLAEIAPYARGRAEEISTVLGGAAVALNLSNVWADGRPGSALIPHVRLRDFEVPVCRGFLLTGRTEEIEECFDVGREIETYSCESELIDKVRFYLRNEAVAAKIRTAGHARVLRDHRWQNRFQRLFGYIGV